MLRCSMMLVVVSRAYYSMVMKVSDVRLSWNCVIVVAELEVLGVIIRII